MTKSLGGYTLGVLVQSNVGGILQIDGKQVGEALNQYYLSDALNHDSSADGSIMIVVVTDAPLSDRNLYRLAKRAMGGVARTGASLTNGSGDYVIAFSTAEALRRSEEAIYNSLLMVEEVDGHRGTAKALPIGKVKGLLSQ